MVHHQLPADQHAHRWRIQPAIELPFRLQGPHAACVGAGCPACLDTGLACAAWVVYERAQERLSAEMFGDRLAHDLAKLLDVCAADVVRLAAEQPGDNEPIVARIAKATANHCWLLHGSDREHTEAVAHA